MTDTLIKIGAHEYKSDDLTVPDSRVFREAWMVNSGSSIIEIDMERARDIWREKIRIARKPELEKLDVEFLKAIEMGVSTAEIVAKKELLRNATQDPAIENAKTPEELKQVHPAGLIIE